MYTPQRRYAGGSLIHTPTGSPLNELTPRRSVICQAAPTMISPNFSQGHHRPTVGCFLASTPLARSKQAVISPQLRAASGGGTVIKKLTPSGSNSMQVKRRSDLTAHLQSPRSNSACMQSPRSTCSSMQSSSPRTPTSNSMCNEAFQLMQFCNHCNFNSGMDASKGGVKRLRELASPAAQSQAPLQRENSLSEHSQGNNGTSSQEILDKSPLDPKLAELLHENSHHHQQQVEESQGSSYYPFITPPTGNRNISLFQLNSNGNYQLDPGPPKELKITKANPKSRGDPVKQHTSFDSAVRPVVYDWNGWWEAEHVLCMMNEESYVNYIECKSEETIKKILEKKRQAHSNNNKAMLTTTMSPDRWQRRSCSHFGFRRGSGQNWVRRMKIRKPISPTPPSPPPPPPPREKLNHKSAGRYCIEPPNRDLKLIVSIPFRQLITDRQMKKYCVAGAKHRIPTEYME